MRKLFLIAVIGVAGVMSAKSGVQIDRLLPQPSKTKTQNLLVKKSQRDGCFPFTLSCGIEEVLLVVVTPWN